VLDLYTYRTHVELRMNFSALKKQGYKGTVRLKPSCLDATDKRYWGKAWRLDIDKDWVGI
jgi:hypothetical protein